MSQPRGTGKLLLPSHLSTISLNAYLPQFFLPCPIFNYYIDTKMQKHIIKRQEQAQEPDSDTAGTLELSG